MATENVDTGFSATNNYATICRLCLEHDGYMFAIFNYEESNDNLPLTTNKGKFDILDKIFQILRIEINYNDKLPKNICHRCLYKIELCCDFKNACLQSDAILQQNYIPYSQIQKKCDFRTVVDRLKFEEFSLKNHKFIENNENIQNVVTVVDPTAQCCDSENEQEACPAVEEAQIDQDVMLKLNQSETTQQTNNSDLENETISEVNEFKNVFMCQYCDKAFVNSEMCYLHEQSSHDTDSPFICMDCDMAFGDRINYTAHLKSVHQNDKPFGCPECDRAFGRRSDLRKHTIVHTGIKPFTCPICFKSFSRNTNLNKHLRIHSGHKPHVCPNCPRTFISKGDLSRHAMIHTGIKPFSCSHCEQSFGRRDKLVRHEKRHLKMNMDADKTEPEMSLSEQFLSHQFNSEIKQEVEDSDQWENSEKMIISLDPYSHNDEANSYQQILANKNLNAREQLTSEGFPGFSAEEVNIAKSALLEPFFCTVCGKQFPTNESLQSHLSSHIASASSSEAFNILRPYVCKICKKSFTRKRELDRHISTHTGFKPFECTVCSKKFGRKDKLVRHMRVHDGNKDFACTFCPASFARKDGLMHHLKVHAFNLLNMKDESNSNNNETQSFESSSQDVK